MNRSRNKRVHLTVPQPRPLASQSSNPDASGDGPSNEMDIFTPSPEAVPQVEVVQYKALPPRDEDCEWEYSMRRGMQEIIPNLYLGAYASASGNKLEDLKARGISHIVCVRHVMERSVIRPMHEGHFVYNVVEMGDDVTISLIPFCHQVSKFIKSGLATGGSVLVHGNAGISRSAVLVTAYIMGTYGVSAKKALRHIQTRRLSANPSDWFMLQLKEFEPIYQAMHDQPLPLPDMGDIALTRPLKRQLDEADLDGDSQVSEVMDDYDMDAQDGSESLIYQ